LREYRLAMDETWQYVPSPWTVSYPKFVVPPSKEKPGTRLLSPRNRRKGTAIDEPLNLATREDVPCSSTREQTPGWSTLSVGRRLDHCPDRHGRVTLYALELNRERVKRIREADVAVGRHLIRRGPGSGERRLSLLLIARGDPGCRPSSSSCEGEEVLFT